MGRYDEQKPSKNLRVFKLGFIFLTGMLIFYVIFGMILGDENEMKMCKEIVTMMLDDPDHLRLHNDYPEITMNLHQYLDANCPDDMGYVDGVNDGSSQMIMP